MFSNASSFNQSIDTAFVIIFGICLIFLIGITFTLIYFSIKYSKKRHPKPVDVKDNKKLELTWIVIPTILVLIMFWVGYKGYLPTRQVPANAIEIKVTGMMWTWMFDYKNGKHTINELVVPIGKAIKLDLFSPDVLHSFYVPAFRIKEDVVPGKDNWMWFQANEIGEYDILCAEYCGTRHAYMLGKVKVVSENDYLEWYNDIEPVSAETEHIGLQVIKKNACVACHSLDGVQGVGPSFKGLYGSKKTVETDGKKRTVTADEAYIKKSIYEPNADVVEGFNKGLMIPYKEQITEEELAEVIDFIKSLTK
ncbi:MAG: cytochrome c oxidase subunit II [Bacteroidetes bacterium]|nr:cytochrome c oxidase subunit II [Bacteroidota bacterium]MBT4968965.1 cytochrome c oxidase subunit II [Bacteroidota bacterium]